MRLNIRKTLVLIFCIFLLTFALIFTYFFLKNNQITREVMRSAQEQNQENNLNQIPEENTAPVRLDNLETGALISSPLIIKGSALGSWFFEGSFPVVLVNWDGLIIGEGVAKAQSDWMTSGYVPFEAQIIFTSDKDVYSDRGTLIFKKDNPSGLPQLDAAWELPVIIGQT